MQRKQQQLIALGVPVAFGATLAYTEVASAQSTPSTAISQMQTDATAIQSMTAVLIPLAVGSIVFAAAALLFKRYIYS